MSEMTSRERFQRMFEHREADRVPIVDHPWPATIERWQREGMPKDTNWVDYFGIDDLTYITVDTSPRYEERTVEETDEYIVRSTRWGTTMKNWKHASSTPEFLKFTVTDPDSWRAAKRRMTPDRDRVNWDHLKKNYPIWREKGHWIQAHLWFGFDVTHAWTVGTERLLMAMVTDPEWCVDMFNHFLDVGTALFDMIWDAGYEFDCAIWPDDLGYKRHTFFSIEMYRELLKPVQKRAIEWAHARGVKTHLHSCGYVRQLVPEFVEIGLDALNPLEVKAGMDPLGLKRSFGDRLVFQGGINAMLWNQPEAIRAEMERVVPAMKEKGGYIFASDHSIPSSVSLEDFRGIVALAKRLGSYE